MMLDIDPEPRTVHAPWLKNAFTKDTTALVAEAKRHLEGRWFDTIVCTGLSGMLVAPIIWRALDVPYLAVVRKEESPASHSGIDIEGTIGSRWIFVDDFVSTGGTRSRVRQALVPYATTFVGTYCYRYPKFLVGDDK